MIPPSSLGKLVLGYLEEEGLHKTAESFHHEFRASFTKETDPFTTSANLKAILEDYLHIKNSVNDTNSEDLIPSLWKNLDVLIGQLKYHTLVQPTPLNPQKLQKPKKKKCYHQVSSIRPLQRSTNKSTNGTNKHSQRSNNDTIEPVQPLAVRGMLASTGSTWQSVNFHSSNRPNINVSQESLQNKNKQGTAMNARGLGSIEITRDYPGSTLTTSDQRPSEIIGDDQGSVSINVDQGSIGITGNLQRSTEAISEHESVGISVDHPGSTGIIRDHESSNITDDHGSEGITTDQYGSTLSSATFTDISIDRPLGTPVNTDHLQEDVPISHGLLNTGSGDTIDMSFRSPKRKGNPPKKRPVNQPSPLKIVPQDSNPVDTIDIQQFLDGDSNVDAAMPLLLDAFLNTPLLQEKLAENINKVVGSAKSSDVTEDVVIETIERSSVSTEDRDNEQPPEIPVADILSLLEADPVFESFFSVLDGTKGSPNKDTQSFPACTSSESLPGSSACTMDSVSDSQVQSESSVLLSCSTSSCQSKLSTSTMVTPALETNKPVVASKPLTPEKTTNGNSIVKFKQSEDTEIHVRTLHFSNEITPPTDGDKPEKIPIAKAPRRTMPISPSKRLRSARKSRKKKKNTGTPNRKLLLPNNPIPFDGTQPAINLLQALVSTHDTPLIMGTEIGDKRRNKNLDGTGKMRGTMLHMLQDAAASQRFQGSNHGDNNPLIYQTENQLYFSQPGNSYVQELPAARNPQVSTLNFPVTTSLVGGLPSGFYQTNTPSIKTSQGAITMNMALPQCNIMGAPSACVPPSGNLLQPVGTSLSLSKARRQTSTSTVVSQLPSSNVAMLSNTTTPLQSSPASLQGYNAPASSNTTPLLSYNAPLPLPNNVPSLSNTTVINTRSQPLAIQSNAVFSTAVQSTSTGFLTQQTSSSIYVTCTDNLKETTKIPKKISNKQSNSVQKPGKVRNSFPVSNSRPSASNQSSETIDSGSGRDNSTILEQPLSFAEQSSQQVSSRNSTKSTEELTISFAIQGSKQSPTVSSPISEVTTHDNTMNYPLTTSGVSSRELSPFSKRTMFDMPLSNMSNTSGQTSTESSPISKKAEDCISSFCNISQLGGSQLTIQNNTLVSKSDREMPTLSVNNRTKMKSKKNRNGMKSGMRSGINFHDMNKECTEKVSEKPGDQRTMHREDDSLSDRLHGNSSRQGGVAMTTHETQGQKRPASKDLKENKPKKSKSSKKSKPKRDLPKNFDVDKFLSRLHYVEK